MPEAIYTQRWKITKNVSFNIFVLCGQKFIKNAQKMQLGEFLKN